MTYKFLATLFISAVCMLVPAAKADLITPTGLNPGDEFRFLTVTGFTTDGTSDDIAHYDAFAEFSAIAAGLTSYNGTNVTWHALVSTPTFNANTALPNSIIPIYDLDGALLFSASHDIWSGLGSGAPDGGGSFAVWTGTFVTGIGEETLGNTSGSATFGRAALGAGAWLCCGDASESNTLPIYTFSDVLVVPTITGGGGGTAVPEPGSITLLITGLLALGYRRRRKSAHPLVANPASSRAVFSERDAAGTSS
jgi:hypothetical protein